LDALGNIVWNKLLGGSSSDNATHIQQTTDGGYIISGSSESSDNGDVSGTNHGSYDYWIVKLDDLGNIVWNKLLGGSSNETATNIQQTSDGGYILSGFSSSSASGNVSETNHGSSDYWIVKLDDLGNIVWNKLLGGSSNEFATNIQQTSDEGYIISGYSSSSASGNVSETNHGFIDYWIVKLDALGNIVWNKLLGGRSSDAASNIQQTTDGGYIISGYSVSSASGNVLETNHGIYDYWIVKLDALGNIVN
jgi:pyocin large subunit-like protein